MASGVGYEETTHVAVSFGSEVSVRVTDTIWEPVVPQVPSVGGGMSVTPAGGFALAPLLHYMKLRVAVCDEGIWPKLATSEARVKRISPGAISAILRMLANHPS